MRVTAITIVILVLVTVSLGWAGEKPIGKAYSLYFQGKMNAAIKIFEDYVKEYPDPKVMYFLGYAYYEIKKMDVAIKYFDDAYLIDPEFSPIPVKERPEPETLILE